MTDRRKVISLAALIPVAGSSLLVESTRPKLRRWEEGDEPINGDDWNALIDAVEVLRRKP